MIQIQFFFILSGFFWKFCRYDLTNRSYSYIVVAIEKVRAMEQKMKWFEKQCRESDLRLTPQRVAIYRLLDEATDHPSTDTIYRRVRESFPNISLDTVNRTLITFNEAGIAFIVEGSGDVRRYDAGLDSHQHFKCIKCKRIIDFHHEPFDNIDVPESVRGKFEVLRKTVYFEGLCNNCTSEKEIV